MKFKNIKKKSPPAGGKREEFPSNSRSIPASPQLQRGETEHSRFTFPKINHTALLKIYGGVLKVFVVIVFMIAVVIVTADLRNNLQARQSIDRQRGDLMKNLNFWEDFIAKHNNFRDAYFQASILEYQMGDISKAKIYVEKGLALDPNSENGRKIEQLLK